MKHMVYLLTLIILGTAAPRGTAVDYEHLILDKINAYRSGAGLAPVRLDESLSGACALHARYITSNDVPMNVDFAPHDENPRYPGYTVRGKKAAENSIIISTVEPDAAVDYWMGTTFHRIPILAPGLKSIGAGNSRGGRYGSATVVDIFSDAGPADRDTVVYPGPDRENVPLGFGLMGKGVTITEHPDPMPDDADKVAGYPVTATFARSQKVTGAAARLTDEKGKTVPVWVYSPERPAYDRDTQQNTITIIPRDYLLPDTRYTVKVEAVVDGMKWREQWNFKTMKKADPVERKGGKAKKKKLK